MFANAERLHMTVAKLVTGQDMPISNLEMALYGTFDKVKQRLDVQRKRAEGQGGKGGRRR